MADEGEDLVLTHPLQHRRPGPFPGIYLRRDPHGGHYLVDHTGDRPTSGLGHELGEQRQARAEIGRLVEQSTYLSAYPVASASYEEQMSASQASAMGARQPHLGPPGCDVRAVVLEPRGGGVGMPGMRKFSFSS